MNNLCNKNEKEAVPKKDEKPQIKVNAGIREIVNDTYDDLKDKLNICQMTNRNLQDKINELQSSCDDLKNKLNIYARQNDELKKIIEEQKNQLKLSLDKNSSDAGIFSSKKLNLSYEETVNDNNFIPKENIESKKKEDHNINTSYFCPILKEPKYYKSYKTKNDLNEKKIKKNIRRKKMDNSVIKSKKKFNKVRKYPFSPSQNAISRTDAYKYCMKHYAKNLIVCQLIN